MRKRGAATDLATIRRALTLLDKASSADDLDLAVQMVKGAGGPYDDIQRAAKAAHAGNWGEAHQYIHGPTKQGGYGAINDLWDTMNKQMGITSSFRSALVRLAHECEPCRENLLYILKEGHQATGVRVGSTSPRLEGHLYADAVRLAYGCGVCREHLLPVLKEHQHLVRSSKAAKEKYPWDECIADQMKRYKSKETAEKVCGKIKAQSGKAASLMFDLFLARDGSWYVGAFDDDSGHELFYGPFNNEPSAEHFLRNGVGSYRGQGFGRDQSGRRTAPTRLERVHSSRVADRWMGPLPKGWTDASRKKFWESLTSRAPKHKVTLCIKRMEGKISDPGAFCAALADREIPGWRQRVVEERRKKKEKQKKKARLRMDEKPPTIYPLSTAEREAEKLQRGDPDWEYRVVPVGSGKAIIEIYDEDKELVGKIAKGRREGMGRVFPPPKGSPEREGWDRCLDTPPKDRAREMKRVVRMMDDPGMGAFCRGWMDCWDAVGTTPWREKRGGLGKTYPRPGVPGLKNGMSVELATGAIFTDIERVAPRDTRFTGILVKHSRKSDTRTLGERHPFSKTNVLRSWKKGPTPPKN